MNMYILIICICMYLYYCNLYYKAFNNTLKKIMFATKLAKACMLPWRFPSNLTTVLSLPCFVSFVHRCD